MFYEHWFVGLGDIRCRMLKVSRRDRWGRFVRIG